MTKVQKCKRREKAKREKWKGEEEKNECRGFRVKGEMETSRELLKRELQKKQLAFLCEFILWNSVSSESAKYPLNKIPGSSGAHTLPLSLHDPTQVPWGLSFPLYLKMPSMTEKLSANPSPIWPADSQAAATKTISHMLLLGPSS